MVIQIYSASMMLTLVSSMKLQGLKTSKYNGMCVERCFEIESLLQSRGAFELVSATLREVEIQDSSKSFRIPVQEGIAHGVQITDGEPFRVKLQNIDIETVDEDVVLDCMLLLQQRIQDMTVHAMIDEAKAMDESMIRVLAQSLSPYVLKWRDRVCPLDFKAAFMWKKVAIHRLLSDVDGYDIMVGLEPNHEWDSWDEVVPINTVGRTKQIGETIVAIQDILNGMTEEEIARRVEFATRLGQIAYERAGRDRAGGEVLRQIGEGIQSEKKKNFLRIVTTFFIIKPVRRERFVAIGI